MGMTYVIADLHGRRDLLDGALAGIELKEGGNPYTIVFLGDYCDRGPNSREVIERLIQGPEKPNAKWICLKGNHDSMLSFCQRALGTIALDWIEDYAHVTLRSYPDQKVQIEHLDWIDKLPLYHQDTYRIYVHAGVNPARPLEEQNEDTLLWFRYPEGSWADYMGKHIVHGHTAKKDGPERYYGRSNFDTMAWKTGRLVVGGFDDEKSGGPVTFFEVINPTEVKGED